jgi:ACR3 family arsenite transporter
MLRLLSVLQKNLVWAIPLSMALGLVIGYLFDTAPLKRLIVPVTFVMVYPMMVTLNVKTVLKGHDANLQLVTQLFNFVLIPLLAFTTGRLFFSGGPEKFALWAVGLFLIGVLPTSGMTISWTGFAKGNKEAAIKMVVFGLVLGALAAPVYTKVFMSATIDVDMLHMFKQIAIFVFLPLLAGLATQTAVIRKEGVKDWNERYKPMFPPFSALGVVMIAFLAMSLKARHIIANPGDMVSIIVPLLVFYLVCYVALSVAGKVFFRREDAIAMVFGVVMRDLSIALAIAMTAFGKQGLTIALLIALAYVVQIQSAAWYVRLVDRIFGQAGPTPAVPDTRSQHAGTAAPLPSPVIEGAPIVPDIRRILYASDLSDTARYAVRYACSIGNRFGASVSLIHVIPDVVEKLSSEVGINLSSHIDRNHWEAFHSKGIAQAKEVIAHRIQETSTDITREIPSCPLTEGTIMVNVGDPAHEIVSTAVEGKYDLVVMGTHGHGKIQAAITGSIARKVIRLCPVPVMVVRLPTVVSQRREAPVVDAVDRPRSSVDDAPAAAGQRS